MLSLRHLLAFTSMALLLGHAHGQCGTLPSPSPIHPQELNGESMDAYLRLARRGGGTPFLIPTVVHIHFGGGVQPLGILHVQPLLDQCNADLRGLNPDIVDVVPAFADLVGDMGMELRLATIDEAGNCMSGVRYHEYDPSVEQPNTYAPTQHTRGYLNIHIFPSINSFATLPGLVTNPYDDGDAIVLAYVSALVNDRSLTHEVGHWAGLYHTFGLTNQTGVPCGDDYIADTPPTAGSPLTCVLDLDDCESGVIENVQNHMDYSSCRVMFTQGQAEHAAAVLTDPALVRANVVSDTNLLATGITAPASCGITGAIYHRPSISCDGTTMSYRAMAEHAVADSVHWTFPGGSPATSTDDHPVVFYASSGNYPVQLTVYGGSASATVNTTVQVQVPDPNANGLTVISTFPFTEDFENGFTLPQPNMFAVESSTPTWQPFAQAGYASDNSLYVPAEPVGPADTNDLVIGNFDFSTLALPTVRFKVASSYYATSGWSTIHLRFRDQCSNIFQGNPWSIHQLNEFATDQGMNFVPSNDGQWTTITTTIPEWNMATSAELVLRLMHPVYPDIFTPEAVYIDDLYVGELPISTTVPETGSASGFILAPNPAHDQVQLRLPCATSSGVLRVTDATGRLLEQRRITSDAIELNVGAWAPGAYLVAVRTDEGWVQRRLMVE